MQIATKKWFLFCKDEKFFKNVFCFVNMKKLEWIMEKRNEGLRKTRMREKEGFDYIYLKKLTVIKLLSLGCGVGSSVRYIGSSGVVSAVLPLQSPSQDMMANRWIPGIKTHSPLRNSRLPAWKPVQSIFQVWNQVASIASAPTHWYRTGAPWKSVMHRLSR